MPAILVGTGGVDRPRHGLGVVGVDARSDVAEVVDGVVVLDGGDEMFVGEAVRQHPLPGLGPPEQGVPIAVELALPHPARRREVSVDALDVASEGGREIV